MTYLMMILSLLKKEILAVFKDRTTRGILIVPPILQAFLFGYVATFDLKSVNYVYLDASHSSASVELGRKIDGSGFFKRVNVASMDEARDLLNDGEVLMLVQVQADFAKRLAHAEKASVLVITDGRNSTTAATALAYVSGIIADFNRDYLGHQNLVIDYRSWYNDGLQTRWNIVPALVATLSMIQTIMLAALSVAREREKGTFEQLLVTPLSMTQLLIGKAIPPIVIGLAQATVILLVALFWYEIPFRGSIVELYVGLLAFVSACVGLGLTVSAISNSMQQAMLYAFVMIVPLALLSGLMTPIANMPELWQDLTCLNPLRYAISICRCVYLEGESLLALRHEVGALLLFSVVTMPLAGWFFRHHLS